MKLFSPLKKRTMTSIMFNALNVMKAHNDIIDDENGLKIMYYLHTCLSMCHHCVNKAIELDDIDMPMRCAMYRFFKTCKRANSLQNE